MLRHSKSFLISLIIHVILLIAILFTWDKYASVKKVDCSTLKECDRVCVVLCNVAPKKKMEAKKKKIDLEPLKESKKEVTLEPIQETKKYVEVKKTEVKKTEVKEQKEPLLEEPIVKEEVPKEQIVQKSQAVLDEERKLKQENVVKEYLEINTQEIAMLLQDNLYYPRSARKRNITGQITVKFTLGLDSKVYDVLVVKSNSEILSRAAIKTIEDLSGEFPRPQQVITLSVPIGYELK